MAEFQAVKVPRVSDSIVAQIEGMILEGLLKPGEKLPPERELAERLDVSRPSLREAIVVLEARGLLQSRRGGGTFVCDVTGATITDPLVSLMESHPETTFDVLELRHALEEAAAALAAQRATESDRRLIEQRHRDLEAIYDAPGQDREGEAHADMAFHLSIADASHNLALVHVMRGLMTVLENRITFNLDRIRENPKNHDEIKRQHKVLFDAVTHGDAEAARDAARKHLTFVQEALHLNTKREEREERARRRLSAD